MGGNQRGGTRSREDKRSCCSARSLGAHPAVMASIVSRLADAVGATFRVCQQASQVRGRPGVCCTVTAGSDQPGGVQQALIPSPYVLPCPRPVPLEWLSCRGVWGALFPPSYCKPVESSCLSLQASLRPQDRECYRGVEGTRAGRLWTWGSRTGGAWLRSPPKALELGCEAAPAACGR